MRVERVVKAVSEPISARRERGLLWCILGASLVIQLLLAPYRGFFGDMQMYLRWAMAFNTHPLMVYSSSSAAYPPLTIYVYAALEQVYRGLGHLLGFSDQRLAVNELQRFSTLWFLAKLPTIGANLGASWLIYRLARLATSARWALLATLAYALAPSLLLDGALWGQTDGAPVFLVLLAIVALQRRPLWAGALLGAAVMIKPQPVIFIPILLLYLALTGGWRDAVKASLGVIGAMLVICAPFLLPPRPEIIVFYHNATLVFPLVSGNAFNLWFLLNPALLSQTPLIGSLTAVPIGWLLFLPVYGLALALVWRRRSLASLYLALALAAIGFFELTALQHERYLFQALAFLLLAAAYYRPSMVYYALASFTVFTNMLAACALEGYAAAPIKESWLNPLFPFFWRPPVLIFVTLLLNLALLVAMTVSCIAQLRGGATIAARDRAHEQEPASVAPSLPAR